MTEAFSLSLPIALGVAASPMTIVALMILLMTPRAIPNSYFFLLGWFTGLFLVGGLVIANPGLNAYTSSPTPVSGWIRIGLGSLFLIICIFLAMSLPRKGQETRPPKWLEKVDTYGPFQSMNIGLLFSILNIKNAAMVASGAVVISAAGLPFYQEVLLLILFCIVASLGVLLTQAIYLFLRSSAESFLARSKVWLQRYSSMILMFVLIVFGFFLFYQGIVLVLRYSV
jgi:hypothetical protein